MNSVVVLMMTVKHLLSRVFVRLSAHDTWRSEYQRSERSIKQCACHITAYCFQHNKTKRKQTHERHTRSSETPLFIYLGLLLHAHTRKKDLVDKLSHLGLCISYDRVLRLSADLANSVCRRFEQEQVVCPPKLRTNLFTTAAVDNIDHNPSSTTATDSFHATGISMFQHPTAENEGQSR